MNKNLSTDILGKYQKQLKWLVFIFAILLYCNTLKHEMALDDYSVIQTHNHVQKGLAGIGDILTTNYRNGNNGFNDGLYRPLSLVLFALEKEFFDSNTSLAHGINILLYALACMFLFICLRNIFKNYPLIVPLTASLVFLVHPLHTEVVANIKGRDDLLAFAGFVFALFYLLKHQESKNLKQLILGILFFVIALFSKESSVVFALMIPALLFFKEDYKIKDALKTTALLLPFALAFMLLRVYIIGNMPNEIDPGNFGILNNALAATDDSSLRWGTTFMLQVKFLIKLFTATPLIHDYSYNLIPLVKLISLQSIVGILIFIGLIYYAVLGILKKNTFGIIAALYLLSITVASQILMPIGTVFAERLLFIAILPFGVFISLVINTINTKNNKDHIKKQKYTLALLLICLVLFVPSTFLRNTDWKNNISLYSADINKGKESARINYNYGTELYNLGKATSGQNQRTIFLNTATEYLKTAIKIYPAYSDAYNNLGLVYSLQGDYKNAELVVLEGVKINASYQKNYLNLALIYFDSQQYKKCISSATQYVSLKPAAYETYFLMGQAAGNLQDFDAAINYLNQAVSIKADYLDAYNFLGMAYGIQQKHDMAISNLQKALKIQPNHIEALLNLSLSYQSWQI